MSQPNPSTAQARVMVDELHRHGVDLAVISPGSRSAALAIAFEEHPSIETRVMLDERSAAFFALGRSLATNVPTVAVATSGTAVANYLPAIVEADLAMVPLIVLTADRPPELRHVGSNQTIDQVRLFGDRTRWFCDVGLADPTMELNGYWRTTVSQAVARANGHGARPGPVHLNVSFREPTVPVVDDGRTGGMPYEHSTNGRPFGAPWQADGVARPGSAKLDLPSGARGLVIAGQGDYDRPGLISEAQRLGWPVLATALSGMRDKQTITAYHHLLVDGLPGPIAPEVLVTIGHVGPSTRLVHLSSSASHHVHLDRWGAWRDPYRQATHVLEADPVETLASHDGSTDPAWAELWSAADAEMVGALDTRLNEDGGLSGPSVARSVGASRAKDLVVSSSMAIRDVDAFMRESKPVLANRGASGIDGFVSTALGVGSALPATVALSGDLSFLHDAGGLLVDRCPNVVFVVVDNNGGGLFDLLPQAKHAPAFERLFVAPHDRDLSSLARFHGLGSTEVAETADLEDAIGRALDAGAPHLVVAVVEREADLKLRRILDDVARSVVAGL